MTLDNPLASMSCAILGSQHNCDWGVEIQLNSVNYLNYDILIEWLLNQLTAIMTNTNDVI